MQSKKPMELFCCPCPGQWSTLLMMEHLGLDCIQHDVDIKKGEQFKPEFKKLNPFCMVPTLLDHETGSERPLNVFDSGAILVYLARKYDKFCPNMNSKNPRDFCDYISWFMSHQSGLATHMGSYIYYRWYRDQVLTTRGEKCEKLPKEFLQEHCCNIERYLDVFEEHLCDKQFAVNDELTIVDMALYSWFVYLPLGFVPDLNNKKYNNIKRYTNDLACLPMFKKVQPVLDKHLKLPGGGSEEEVSIILHHGESGGGTLKIEPSVRNIDSSSQHHQTLLTAAEATLDIMPP
ncbi:hypothetical protein DFA_08520 [Cavenderia fasciculata]|uniref:Glutathione S-transferase n=1 Tax=Cavenderia fasciculata TaxID=261658 RepID=F4Q2Q7_CACFS|nr:uncharacterized protein DFA_08520 [Cavenderia fasciculata]EGG17524.1 hypothetical protein DFA_08520 [Cavenderia fasciculata]|eukprot:XP_004356008.1 hypothetical protein DFA_08520 [Cavenderia fasciculata]